MQTHLYLVEGSLSMFILADEVLKALAEERVAGLVAVRREAAVLDEEGRRLLQLLSFLNTR